MSSIEYRGLRGKIAKEIDWANEGGTWLSLCEGLIAEGSENNIVSSASLLNELERQDNLGIDNLDGLKELLKEMNEWAVIDEVNTFEMKRQRYVSLRDKIVLKLEELNDLNRLIALSKPPLTEAIVNTIDSVRALFKEFESRNRLGPSCFRIVRKILSDTRKEDLLKEVEDFEKERKEEDLEHRKRVEAEARSKGKFLICFNFLLSQFYMMSSLSPKISEGSENIVQAFDSFGCIVVTSYGCCYHHFRMIGSQASACFRKEELYFTTVEP